MRAGHRRFGETSVRPIYPRPAWAGIGGIAHRSSFIAVVPLHRVGRITWTIIVGKDVAIKFASPSSI
jgi:hypothetical protein